MNKTQFNTRIGGNLKEAVKIVSAASRMSQEELTELAFASLFGATNPDIKAKQGIARRKVKELHISLSFNHPDYDLAGSNN